MAYAEVESLVFPDSICLGEGLYDQLFLVGAHIRLQRWQRKIAFLAQTSTFKTTFYAFHANIVL